MRLRMMFPLLFLFCMGAGSVADTRFLPTDYGAIGDCVADDTAAVQSAVNAASAIGGGTVHFLKGCYRLTAQISKSLNPGPAFPGGAYQQIIFEGEGSDSVISVDAHLANSVFSFYGLLVQFRDLLFVAQNIANDGVTDVGGYVISFGSCFQVEVRNCWFNGIRAGSGIISISDSDALITGNEFSGVAADSAGGNAAVVSFINYSNARVNNNRFEFAKLERGRTVQKQQGRTNGPWIRFDTPGNGTQVDMVSAVNQSTSEVIQNKFSSIYVHPSIVFAAPTHGVSTLLYNRVVISDNNIDCWVDPGIRVYNTRYLEISRNWLGTYATQSVGIDLHNAGSVILQHNNPMIGFGGSAGPTDIAIDAATKTVWAVENSFRQIQLADPNATTTNVMQNGYLTLGYGR